MHDGRDHVILGLFTEEYSGSCSDNWGHGGGLHCDKLCVHGYELI